MSIHNKVALITGGSRGIGRAVAVRLARDGVKLAINYKSDRKSADSVVDLVNEMGVEALAVQADVADSSQVDSMVDQIVNAFGNVDILVNNAGIIHDSLLMRMSEEVWDEVLNTNLKGSYNCTKAVLRHMVRQRWGRVINVVSVVGIEGNPGQSN